MANAIAGGVNTWFSGKSAPEDQSVRRNPLPFIAFAFLVFSPIGMAILLTCYVVFARYRVSHKVIAGLAALYAVPYLGYVTATSSLKALLAHYCSPFAQVWAEVRADGSLSTWLGENWGSWLGTQAPASVCFGLIGGAAWTGWKWLRRPAWEDYTRNPGPLDRFRYKKWSRNIASDIEGPEDGATIGLTIYGERVIQTRQEAAAHTLLAGGSGAGKTTTMLVGIRDAIRRGEGVVLVDLKGAADVPAQMKAWAERYDRRFLHWSITEESTYLGPAETPAFYDPLSRGDASRRKDLIIGSEKWDVEYYKEVAASYIQNAFRVSDLLPNPGVDSLTDLAHMLDMTRMKKRCLDLFAACEKTAEGVAAYARDGEKTEWWNQLGTILDSDADAYKALDAMAGSLIGTEETERSAIRGISHRIQSLRQSTAGAWLRRDPAGTHDIDLRRAADEGWVVVFSLDSSNYEATAAKIGGLVIQDLKTVSSELRHNPAQGGPFHVYVDEFAAMESTNVIGLLNKARDAQMPCMLSTQALADMARQDPAFLDQVMGVISSFIIHRANTEADAEVFAGLTGKHEVFVKRYGVEMTSALPGGMGTGAATGQGTIQKEWDYRVTGPQIQELEPGQCVYVAKAPKARVVHPVTVIREDPDKVTHDKVIADPSPAHTPTPVPLAATSAAPAVPGLNAQDAQSDLDGTEVLTRDLLAAAANATAQTHTVQAVATTAVTAGFDEAFTEADGVSDTFGVSGPPPSLVDGPALLPPKPWTPPPVPGLDTPAVASTTAVTAAPAEPMSPAPAAAAPAATGHPAPQPASPVSVFAKLHEIAPTAIGTPRTATPASPTVPSPSPTPTASTPHSAGHPAGSVSMPQPAAPAPTHPPSTNPGQSASSDTSSSASAAAAESGEEPIDVPPLSDPKFAPIASDLMRFRGESTAGATSPTTANAH